MKYFIPVFLLLSAASLCAAEKTGRIEVIGSDSVDFGRYPAAEKKTAVYRIRNAGEACLKILRVRKTCGCATAVAGRTELEPDDETTIEVTILPNSIFNRYSKHTFVESSDPDKKFIRLRVSGEAVPLFRITPGDSVNAGRIPLHAPWSRSFALQSTDQNAELGVPQVESDCTAEVTMTRLDNNRYRLGIVLPPQTNSGDIQCTVAIPVLTPTNHPPLKIGISGKAGTELTAVPSVLNIPLSDTAISRKFTLRMLGVGSRALDPAELRLPQQEGIVFDVAGVGNGRDLAVTAVIEPELTKQLLAEESLPLRFAVPNASSATLMLRHKQRRGIR